METVKKKIDNLIERPYLRLNSIEQFNNVISEEYSKKNIKSLKHTIYNLVPLKECNSDYYPYDISKFMKYLRVEGNKHIIEDNNNSFLKEKDNKKMEKNYSKMNYIDYKDKDKIKGFITFTNPTKYHYYKTNKKGKLINNSNCNYDNLGMTIEQSFINMNKILRAYYKEVKKMLDRKKKDTNFNYVSVLENHKNLSIHSHNIYYMTKEQIEVFKKCYKIIKKRFNLKQCKFLILKKSKGSSYLMKYLLKDNESDFYKQYRSYYSKYRFFKTSNITKYPQKVIDKTYNYLLNRYSKLSKKKKISKVYIVERYIDRYLKVNYTEKPIEVYKWDKLKEEINKQYEELYNSNLFDTDTIEDIIKSRYSHISIDILDKIDYKNYYIKKVDSIVFKNGKVLYKKSEYETDINKLEKYRLC